MAITPEQLLKWEEEARVKQHIQEQLQEQVRGREEEKEEEEPTIGGAEPGVAAWQAPEKTREPSLTEDTIEPRAGVHTVTFSGVHTFINSRLERDGEWGALDSFECWSDAADFSIVIGRTRGETVTSYNRYQKIALLDDTIAARYDRTEEQYYFAMQGYRWNDVFRLAVRSQKEITLDDVFYRYTEHVYQ